MSSSAPTRRITRRASSSSHLVLPSVGAEAGSTEVSFKARSLIAHPEYDGKDMKMVRTPRTPPVV
eukprot:5845597-Pyramimonas_sp.AAC.1